MQSGWKKFAKKVSQKHFFKVELIGIEQSASELLDEADYVLYTLAGPEISVATTKAFSTQLIVCYLLALELAYIKKYINKDKYIELINELKSLSDKSEYIMKNLTSSIQKISSEFANIKDAVV